MLLLGDHVAVLDVIHKDLIGNTPDQSPLIGVAWLPGTPSLLCNLRLSLIVLSGLVNLCCPGKWWECLMNNLDSQLS